MCIDDSFVKTKKSKTMKTKHLILVGLIFSNLIIQAQNNSGKVNYDEIIKLDFSTDSLDLDPAMAAIVALIPKSHRTQKILYFTNEESLYHTNKEQNNYTLPDANGNTVKIGMTQPDDKFFSDLKNKKCIQQKEFMTRKFLIEAESCKSDWKLTGNHKLILDYPCQEAVFQSKEDSITAWFTPSIPVSSGPNGYGGLPGLILAIEGNNGKQNFKSIATMIELQEIDKALVTIPKEGKKVTEKEFEMIEAEKSKEMKQQNGNSGNVIIQYETK